MPSIGLWALCSHPCVCVCSAVFIQHMSDFNACCCCCCRATSVVACIPAYVSAAGDVVSTATTSTLLHSVYASESMVHVEVVVYSTCYDMSCTCAVGSSLKRPCSTCADN
jgi:hypothetical protein